MTSLFRPATELMVQYAAYHRDRRNIATHFAGVPMIVFSVGILLARPQIEIGPLSMTLAALAWFVTTGWYLTRGNVVLGLAVSLVNFLLAGLAQPLGGLAFGAWLACALGSFALGWTMQCLGHYYEGRKPAFADDLTGLLVGPMFVAGEALFALGLCRPLAQEIERRTGPTLLRDLAHPVA